MSINFTHVYAVPRTDMTPLLVDVENPETGVPSFGSSLESLAVRYPGLTRMTYEEYHSAVVACFCTAPTEINVDQWDYALGVLPPLNWIGRGDTESFKSSEFTVGDLTACYVRIGEKYWSMTRSYVTPHDWLVEQVRQHLATTH